MCCLLYTKSKTLSHLRESLTFYKDTVLKLINNKEKQLLLLKALYQTWSHSTTYLKMIIEFLLNNRLVEYIILIEFIFNYINETKFDIFPYYQFELVDYIIEHSIINIQKFRKELHSLQEALSQSDENLQSDIIKNIENLEINIDRLKNLSETIHNQTFQLHKELKTYHKELLQERIIQFTRKYEKEIGININSL
jgi:hypothetical protein